MADSDSSDSDGDLLGLGFDTSVVIGSVVTGAIEAVLTAIEPFYNKRPQHTSALSSVQWVDELMEGHPDRIQTVLGVRLHVFKALLKTLCKIGFSDSKHVKLGEQLAIFLYTCVTGLTLHHGCERFQRPTVTISK